MTHFRSPGKHLHLLFLEPILQEGSLGGGTRGSRHSRRPSPGSGRRGSLQAREAGLGEKMTASVTLSGARPALELSADRPTPITPCSIPPSPLSPLGLSFHTYRMVIIWPTPEREEELRTEPCTEEQSTLWGDREHIGAQDLAQAARLPPEAGLKTLVAPAASLNQWETAMVTPFCRWESGGTWSRSN